MLTIRQRAHRAERALSRYTDDDDPVAGLIDLLADAMHWCRREGRAFDALLATATGHYQTETLNETGVLP